MRNHSKGGGIKEGFGPQMVKEIIDPPTDKSPRKENQHAVRLLERQTDPPLTLNLIRKVNSDSS